MLEFPLSWAILRSRLHIGAATDRRLNLVNKLILGIQTIKSYDWEEPITQRIKETRRIECRRFLRLYFWKGFSDGVSKNAGVLLAFPIILVPLAEGRALVASAILTALSLVDSIAF